VTRSWDYVTVRVEWRDWPVEAIERRTKNWVVRLPNDRVIVGWDDIFAFYGRQGWELISVVVADFYSTPSQELRARVYRLFFKRPA
jgi:hypothetical protein